MFEIDNTLSFNTDKLVVGTEYDYVTRTSLNQGILQTTGMVNVENINSPGTWSLGLLQMDFFYRNKPWYAGQFVRKITPKIEIPQGSILFFTTLLNKQKQKLLSVLVRNVDKTFKETKIKLPLTLEGEINFDFMESFIAELEAQRIAELEAYLLATGLKDYELTEEEINALNNVGHNSVQEFKISALFDVETSRKRFDANKVNVSKNNGFPYVVRTAQNNGIKGYINEDKQFLNQPNTISFGQDTATMFYQKDAYFTGDKIKILHNKNEGFNRLRALYFITCMSKSFETFSWGASSFNVSVINNQLITLPVLDGGIDYLYMETFISAIQKLVIKDVVKYADNKILATKTAVAKK